METLVRLLRREHCSLVVRDAAGNVTLYHKQGVRDLEDLLDHAPATLRGAELADKVVGKAAAGMMVAFSSLLIAYRLASSMCK